MSILSKRKIAGGLLLAASGLFGKETFAWVLGKGLDFVSQGADEMTIGAFPWQNALATVMALVGAYLAFWPTKRPTKVTRQERLRQLSRSADHFVSRVRFSRGLEWSQRPGNESALDMARDGQSILIFFKEHGLAVPTFQSQWAENVCVGMEEYFTALIPFMRDGHVSQVEASMHNAVRRAENAASTFIAEKWYYA